MRLRLLPVAFAIAVCTTLAACGGSDAGSPSDAGSASDGTSAPVKIKVGSIPIATEAPLYVGIDQGFFADEGLDVEVVYATGGSALVPSVVSGDMQFGTSNPISLITAGAKGLPLEMIAQGARGGTDDANDFSAITVKGDSDIKTPKDLEGRTVAVNTLKNIGEVVIKSALDNSGVDISKVKFVELPFPSMNAAVASGQIDAAWSNEPFLTQGLGEGQRAVKYVYSGTRPELTVGMYFTSQAYAEKNPEVVKKFVRAINKSVDFSQQNPDVVRSAIASYAKIDAAVVKQIRLPLWKSQVDTAGLQFVADQMVKYQIIDKPIDVTTLIATQG